MSSTRNTPSRFLPWRASALVAAACAAALVAVAPAAGTGSRPTSVQGTWSITSAEVVAQRPVGQLVFLRQQGTSSFAGNLAGTTTFDLNVFLRPDFSSFGWATETFTGTLDGRTGTLDMLEWATGAADGSVRIDAIVTRGTGGLRGTHGAITFVSPLCLPETCEGTYSGTLVR